MKLLAALAGPLTFLASISTHAYPNSLDIAGIQLGDNISDVRQMLYENNSDAFLSFQRNANRQNQATFFADKLPHEQWTFLWLPDGEIVAIERFVDYSQDEPRPDNEATSQALYEKYGEPITDGTSLRRTITWQTDRNGERLQTDGGGRVINNVCQNVGNLLEGRQVRISSVEDCGIHLRISYGMNRDQGIVRMSSTLFDAAKYLDHMIQEQRENEPEPEPSTGGAADI